MNVGVPSSGRGVGAAPWKIKVVVGTDVVVNVVSTWGFIALGGEKDWNLALAAIVAAWAIYAAVWWGLLKGKRLGLLAKAVLLLFQILEVPAGTVISLVQVYLLASRESRSYFGLSERR